MNLIDLINSATGLLFALAVLLIVIRLFYR